MSIQLRLRKARRLESSIKNETELMVSDSKDISVRLVLESSVIDLNNAISNSVSSSLKKRELILNLLRIKSDINTRVSTVNASSGITSLMKRRGDLISEKHLYDMSINMAMDLTGEDLIYMAKKFDDKVEQVSNGFGSYSPAETSKMKAFVLPSLIKDSEEYYDLKSKVIDLKADIELVEDELMELNTSVTITIPEEDCCILRKQKLIR